MSKVQYKCTIQTSVRCRAETKLHYTEKVIFKKQSSGGGESSASEGGWGSLAVLRSWPLSYKRR